MPIISGIDRALGMFPGWVHPQRLDHLVAELPEVQPPVPRMIWAHRAEQHALVVGDVLAEQREWGDPLWRALEDGQMFDIFGDHRRDLLRACSRSDDRNALAIEVQAFGPARRVKLNAGEGVYPRDLGEFRLVQ